MSEWNDTINNIVNKENYEETKSAAYDMVKNFREQGLDLETILSLCLSLNLKNDIAWSWPFQKLLIERAWKELEES